MISSVILLLALLAVTVFIAIKIIMPEPGTDKNQTVILEETLSNQEEIQINYLTRNPYSRPGTGLKKIKGVVVHYTANPGTSAENNRSYFEGLATKRTTKASSHYIIGIDGEIIQCIPLNEQAYASNDRNDDTISIECCHPDETGEFTKETYESLVALTAALCNEFNLHEDDVIRHYDVTGKLCPLYYVEHEDAWDGFHTDVTDRMNFLISSSGSSKNN